MFKLKSANVNSLETQFATFKAFGTSHFLEKYYYFLKYMKPLCSGTLSGPMKSEFVVRQL